MQGETGDEQRRPGEQIQLQEWPKQQQQAQEQSDEQKEPGEQMQPQEWSEQQEQVDHKEQSLSDLQQQVYDLQQKCYQLYTDILFPSPQSQPVNEPTVGLVEQHVRSRAPRRRGTLSDKTHNN